MNQMISKTQATLWTIATIVAPLVLGSVLTSFYIGFWYARTQYQGPPPAELIHQAIFATTPLALWASVILWWLLHRRRWSLLEMYQLSTSRPAGDLALGVAVGAVWVAIYGLGGVVSFPQMLQLDAAKWASLPTSISAGFCEEFLTRGFLFVLIAGAGGGKASRVLVSALAFGLMHVAWGPWGMLWTAVLGLSLALTVAGRGSVWPAVVAHTLLDLAIEPALIQNAMSGRLG